MVAKKDELAALSIPELKKLCDNAGIAGMLSKSDRIEQLLNQWLQADGIDKALAKNAYDARRDELFSMDNGALKVLCTRASIEPYLKDVMVDRIMKQEMELGHFAPPSAKKEPEPKHDTAKPLDMVSALLESEANRKKEAELKKQQEAAIASKTKELMSMSVNDLKKELTKKGLDATGKKEELIEALSAVREQAEKIAVRKSELTAMEKDELKKLMASCGLPASSAKGAMVEAILAHEEKVRIELRDYAAKVVEIRKKIGKDLEQKTGAELKEMCESKGLKSSGSKEDRIERLVQDPKGNDEVDKIYSSMLRAARREALTAMAQLELQKLCETTGVDPLVKEIVVERILLHESEVGAPVSSSDEKSAKRRKK